MSQNRHERRAFAKTNHRKPKISELPKDQKMVLGALVDCWLAQCGKELLQLYDWDDCKAHIFELADAGLLKFVKGRDGSFSIQPLLPPGGMA